MVIKVVRGNPTPEELAAALAVVRARAAASAAVVPDGPPAVNEWVRATRRTAAHGLPQPGPTAWHTSSWPR
ncbi:MULTISPECIES: acyl-CoA carboxylase epsilon subunit [Streptomyces]|uniref:Acyl-CoA carboxylase subunit epsilon n=1 Tax=Streptomyces xanthii TaxID=2768069 RepID=A0A7H1B261_9ACTN|nr:acyl-CoA carboxylase epsilon subunit [Streptomyces xanthii]QNS02816.1 acyl-CoA carboxylase subunit epsilon [Streptomyces xanthii]